MSKKSEKTLESNEILSVIDKINKALGTTGKVYMGNDHPPLERIRTGILALDVITGGGLPRGKFIEFFGEESAGKTTAALEATANVQKNGGTVAWCAREGFDKAWAQKRGVDLKKVILIDAHYGDTALETSMTLVEEGVLDLLVFDSIQSFGTEREAEAGLEAESFGGGGAGQLWGRTMRRGYAAQSAKGKKTSIIGISQVRSPIGKMGFKGAKPEPEPCGIWAIKHWKSISVRFKKGEPIYENPNDSDKKYLISREFKIKCTKNKTSQPDKSSAYTFFYKDREGIPQGIDRVDQVVRLGRVHGLITNRGAWFDCPAYDGLTAQGLEAITALIRENPEVVDDLEKEILEIAAR